MWIKMEIRRGYLGGSVEHSEGKGRESIVAISRFLCGSPHLCRLKTEGLVPVIKYWTYRSHASDMSPVSLVACCRQMFAFHYYFNGYVGRETGWWTCGSLSRARGCVGRLFLGSSRVHPTLLVACKRLSYTGTTRRKHTLGVCRLAWEAYVSCWSGFPLHGVHQFESLRLLDMSNRLFVAAIK
jgi:hypothetical protein